MTMSLLAALGTWVLPARWSHLYSQPDLGIGLGLVGFLIMMWAWWLFKRDNTAICPTAPSSVLVTRGIYRYTRNPMYLGIVAMMAGLALQVGSLLFYLAALAFFVVIDRAFCPYEERKLLHTFGSEYMAYQSAVRRWI